MVSAKMSWQQPCQQLLLPVKTTGIRRGTPAALSDRLGTITTNTNNATTPQQAGLAVLCWLSVHAIHVVPIQALAGTSDHP
jgi:hypothetical protein